MICSRPAVRITRQRSNDTRPFARHCVQHFVTPCVLSCQQFFERRT
jgi:hypothetical protein